MPNNLVSCAKGTDKIYHHSGITGIITTSFDSPGDNLYGLAYETAAC